MNDVKYITPQELGAKFRLSANTIKRLIWSGKIKALRVGKRGDYRIPESEIEKVFEQ